VKRGKSSRNEERERAKEGGGTGTNIWNEDWGGGLLLEGVPVEVA
jgi:hypothetical protein